MPKVLVETTACLLQYSILCTNKAEVRSDTPPEKRSHPFPLPAWPEEPKETKGCCRVLSLPRILDVGASCARQGQASRYCGQVPAPGTSPNKVPSSGAPAAGSAASGSPPRWNAAAERRLSPWPPRRTTTRRDPSQRRPAAGDRANSLTFTCLRGGTGSTMACLLCTWLSQFLCSKL